MFELSKNFLIYGDISDKYKRFYSISQWSKTPKIWPKNGQISSVLGHILIKLPRLSSNRSERSFCGGLIKKMLKIEGAI